jgi:hypothetical protein
MKPRLMSPEQIVRNERLLRNSRKLDLLLHRLMQLRDYWEQDAAGWDTEADPEVQALAGRTVEIRRACVADLEKVFKEVCK